uniref:Sulfatase domain-containing protein n=1 Tax=Panagrellus redivivus TaxID=6233 RepID=A0A7E4V535_PANRE
MSRPFRAFALLAALSVIVTTYLYIADTINTQTLYTDAENVYATYGISPNSTSNICKFYANPFDSRITDYISEAHPPVKCESRQSSPIALTASGNIVLLNNETKNCQYRPFRHNSGVDDFTVAYGDWMDLNGSTEARLTGDFVDVSCRSQIGIEYFRKQIATIVRRNASIESGSDFVPESDEQLSVILLGFDGLSLSNFIRQLPQSREKMKQMGFIEMEKHAKIADNTFPNWMAMFKGEHTYSYEFNGTVDASDGLTYDSWKDLMWFRYGASSYATLFAEDSPDIAAFNYNGAQHGFADRPPVDHYLRPLYLAWKDHFLRGRSNLFCYDDLPVHKIQLDYVKSFLDAYPNVAKFAFSWLIEVSHDYLNTAGVADKDFADFLTASEKHFNKSIVVVFSDHGNRYDRIRETVVGRLESRLPLLAIRVPDWVKKTKPAYWEALKGNSKVLTSHFDLHATFVHLLKGLSTPPPNLLRGKSLFTPLPANRTCFNAEIPSNFCPCFNEIDLPITEGPQYAQFVLDKVVEIFAEKGYTQKCANMTLAAVKSVSLSIPPKKLALDAGQPSLKTDLLHYRINFEVNPPSKALLEAVVVANRVTGVKTLLGDIERNNRYGNTSHCAGGDQMLKKLCYCI